MISILKYVFFYPIIPITNSDYPNNTDMIQVILILTDYSA